MHWYRGTAEAVYHNMRFIQDSRVDEVLILAGDHVYTMHYEEMIKSHRQQGAETTIAVTEVPLAVGIYIFNKDILFKVLEDAHRRGLQDFGSQIIPDAINKYQIYGYKYQGYWRDVGTIEAYWQANMDLIIDLPPFNLYEPGNQIKTPSVDMPPVKLGPKAQINRSLVSNGCIINGTVLNSVLSPHVYVEEGAQVIDSIVFDDTIIAKDAVVHRSIIDKECHVAQGCCIGYGDDYVPNKDEPVYLNCGITVIGKGARLPPRLKVGRNCKIDSEVQESNFSTLFVPSGSSVVGGEKVLQARF